ncbi:MAG: DUF808 domain-containing protein, partial [Pikeienuella sp.]
MSGLLALLDDVGAIAKLAAAQIDDIGGQAAKVGAKTAGVLIDDPAVTPKYVTGLPAARELPIIWKIARGSLFNKVVILVPIALLLDAFLPWMLPPLLMLGGAYLCFEGAEKIWHALHPHPESEAQEAETLSAAHLEEQRVRGAIKTDFILSAEIVTIALSTIEATGLGYRAAVLFAVAVGITLLVYGAVAVLVKMDDLGMRLTRVGRFAATRAFGAGLVRAMPHVLSVIGVIGTAAMLWVGGNIVIHGAHELGWHWPYEFVGTAAAGAAAMAAGSGAVEWLVTAAMDGVFGLALGLALIPVATKLVAPALALFGG